MTYKNDSAITNKVVVTAQWSDMPEEVVEEVKDLWRNMEFGNDYYYYPWGEQDFYDAENEDIGEEFGYPVIAKYLREHNITECLILFWW